MNVHNPITEAVDGNMTSKGQVLIPKHLRDHAGLVPGGEVTVGLNAQGQVVVAPRGAAETLEQRRARILAAIEAVAGTVDFGVKSTDDYMDDIRPWRNEDW
ncbi:MULTISPECIES: AbrB/MazE/SpoVT family DNA-binding domain-containing protein [unclassified Sphingomonas]|jgi:antitoxin PrlF|uniref:AbrB/MazE/SpoVT family DNA-binding domain-containing protein n=1 Tax=unclassified Sphingomonas TaxID=196159 RepID=UPI000E10A166|nr:AbrB/MazE/SpoVT family DNA-binding domain-containing protein [Sphingomonas sp. FARSPH]AXJ94326.1 AbrB/MazE/SpoVT family DNA-binding domain-containing protein [Sphingomonas sp. FARSPH]